MIVVQVSVTQTPSVLKPVAAITIQNIGDKEYRVTVNGDTGLDWFTVLHDTADGIYKLLAKAMKGAK